MAMLYTKRSVLGVVENFLQQQSWVRYVFYATDQKIR